VTFPAPIRHRSGTVSHESPVSAAHALASSTLPGMNRLIQPQLEGSAG